jgi:hypothetical protein
VSEQRAAYHVDGDDMTRAAWLWLWDDADIDALLRNAGA